MSKYPQTVNWLVWKKNPDGSYQVKNCLTETTYTFGSLIFRFSRKLDGKHNPYTIMPELSPVEVDEMLEALEKEFFLRHSRLLLKSLGSVCYTLWQPQHTRSNSMIPGVLNILRNILWLPLFIVGLCIWASNGYYSYGGNIWTGHFAGLVLGSIVHEACHAASCLHRGGRLFETGVLRSFFVIPGMYVLLDLPRKRIHRLEALVAGVEGNFMLCGLFMVLSVCFREFAGSFETAGMCNLAMGLINLLPAEGLDGMRALYCLLGITDEPGRTSAILCDKNRRQELWRDGLSGRTELLVRACLAAMKCVMTALLVVLGVWEVFSLCSCFWP